MSILLALDSSVDRDNGSFNLSGVLFIPPDNVAGTLTLRSYRLRHPRGVALKDDFWSSLQMGEVLHLRLVRLRMRRY